MAQNLKRFLILLSFHYGMGAFDFLRPKTIHVDRFEGKCREIPSRLVIYMKDMHVGLVNKMTVISTKVVAEKNVDNPLKLQLQLKRCNSKESLDSCEFYQTVNVNHLCDLINAQGTPWTPFVRNSKPPMGCPITRGVHEIVNGTFDGAAFSTFPVSNYYWKVTAKTFDEKTNALLMCVHFEGQVVPV